MSNRKSGRPTCSTSGQRGGQVADGQTGHRFDDRLDTALGGKLCQCGELVERAGKIGVEADHIYPGNAELGQHVEIRRERAHIGAR